MRKAHSKLSSLGRWLWQRRRWAVALAAAVLAGILVCDPAVRFYIYEPVRPRSPLLPKPGHEWSLLVGSDRRIYCTYYQYEDISDSFV